MDTLFRLCSSDLQHEQPQYQSSLNNSSTTRTSSASRSSPRLSYHYQRQHHHLQGSEEVEEEEEEEECFKSIFMDDDEDLSSSSSKHNFSYHNSTSTTSNTNHYHHHLASSGGEIPFSAPSNIAPNDRCVRMDTAAPGWANELLLDAAKAVADKDSLRLQHAMWMLNDLSSPYGDTDQKLAAYFLQALFSRFTDSGESTRRTLASASEAIASSFDSTRKTVLKFQEVSPWTTFGHVASNGAILEAMDGEMKIHIVDVSNTHCTQWPTLLESLATRSDDTPFLRLTVVVRGRAASQKLTKEIAARMEKFARLMGVPFQFKAVYHDGDLSQLNLAELNLKDDEALAVNCVNSLHSVAGGGHRRDRILSAFLRVRPRIVTVVEEEAELEMGAEGYEFFRGFQECVRWFRVYLEALEGSFPAASSERLMLERGAGRAVVELVACSPVASNERRETAASWCRRMRGAGFGTAAFSNEVCDDVRALLRRYKEGFWSMTQCSDAGMFLCWKEQPVVWASAWRP